MRRYSAATLAEELGPSFELIESREEVHRTPAGASFHVGKDGCSYQSFLREGFGIAALDSILAPRKRRSAPF